MIQVFPLIVFVILSLLFCPVPGSFAEGKTTKSRFVADMYDRKIEIPFKVKKIACLPCPAYERIFMLGGQDQIGEVRRDMKTAYPLANLTNPDLMNYSSRITNINPKANINIEEFIKVEPDVVLYYYVPGVIKKFEEASIPVYVIWSNKKIKNFSQGIEDDKRLIRSFADLLGGQAHDQAEKWCRYYDEKVTLIQSRTKDIPEIERPLVYMSNSWGSNPLATTGGNTVSFVINLCGGINAAKNISGARFPKTTLEQVIAWNPDVIIVDNTGNKPDKIIETISTDCNWAVIDAVRNKRIHKIPSGVFYLDKGSSRPLYYLWLAKKLVPEKFQDIDIVKEMKFYFKEFYRYDLSTEDAEHGLRGWEHNPDTKY
jgi:iron complex transport system substrate-binding protein